MTRRCYYYGLFIFHLVIVATRSSRQTINVDLNEPFSMTCCGSNGESISFFDRIKTEEDQKAAWVQQYNRLYQTNSRCLRLEIGKPVEQDKGIYQCRSSGGKLIKEFNIFVRFTLGHYKVNQFLILGDPNANKINIRIIGSLPRMEWYKRKGTKWSLVSEYPIRDPKLKHKTSPKNGSLILKNVTRDDAGLYRFDVWIISNSKSGIKFGEVKVGIGERVKIVGGKTKIVSVKGNKITVRCTATGIPKPVFSFFLPRKKAEPESVKTRYLHDGRTGVAEYTFDGGPTELECSAVNDHGFDKVQLQLPKRGGNKKGSILPPPGGGRKVPGGGGGGGNGTTGGGANKPSIKPRTIPPKKATLKDFFKNKEAVKGLAIIASVILVFVVVIVLVICKICRRRRRRFNNKMADIEAGVRSNKKRKPSKRVKIYKKEGKSKGDKSKRKGDNQKDDIKKAKKLSNVGISGKPKDRIAKQQKQQQQQPKQQQQQQQQQRNNANNPTKSRRGSERRSSSKNNNNTQKKRRSSSRQRQ